MSQTLVAVSKGEREWTNPDRWVGWRKEWIKSMWPKNWYPRFEEWLYTAKQKSFDEFREAERSEVMKEYERLLDEITKQRIAGQPKKGETELDVKKITEEEFRRFLVDKLESLEEHCISY